MAYGILLEKSGLIHKDFLQWTPAHGRASIGQPKITYLDKFYMDTECRLEDLKYTRYKDKGQMVRVMEIHARSTTW